MFIHWICDMIGEDWKEIDRNSLYTLDFFNSLPIILQCNLWYEL